MLSGINRVNSKLADCIKVAESTLQNKEQKSGGGICEGASETNGSDGIVYLQDTSKPFAETCSHSDSETSQVQVRSGL